MSCTASHCSGCRNNFYNGNNSIGVGQCWSLKTAKLKTRFEISTHTPMWIKEAYRKVKKPNCYHQTGYVYMDAIPDYAKPRTQRVAFLKGITK